jgi:DNA-binding winged helix-turn-helix (wHTH) protein
MADNGLRASEHTSYPALAPSNNVRRSRGAAEWPLFVETPERQGFEAHLRSLQTAVSALSRRLPLQRIATVVAQSAMDALDAQAMIVAVAEEDGRLRGVYVAGLPEEAQHRLATIPTTAPTLIDEIDRSLRRDAKTGRLSGTLAALPISQDDRTLGLLVLGRSHSQPFSEYDRTFLDALADLCALALDRLQMCADRSRVRAVLRRRQLDLKLASTQLRVGDMQIDLEEQRITIGSRTVSLTPSEMRLLIFLADEPGRARSRHELLQHLWHTEHVGDERACDVHVSNLRRKIESDPSRPERLVTVRGVGYALQPH